MAFVVKDRVKETTTTTSTGTVTLSGAATGFQSFSVIGNANETYYCIAGQGTSEFEVGIGTYTSSGTTLSRTTVLSSSNSGSLVNFSAGTKDVFCTFPAGVALQQPQYDLYTSGATTWTAPTGVTRVKVICIGGGGGGGNHDAGGPNNGGSGGAGGIAVGIYTVVPGTGYVATVGAGGAGTNTASTNGSAGATSSLGSLLSATGGSGGVSGNSSGADGAAGAGTSGVTANSSVLYGAGGDFVGLTARANGASATAAVTWTAALNRVPGATGAGGTTASDASGGTGGAVYIQYIG
jgi:hypothetical protein